MIQNCNFCQKQICYSDAIIENLAIKEGFAAEINGRLYCNICFDCFSLSHLSAEVGRHSFLQRKSPQQLLKEWIAQYD